MLEGEYFILCTEISDHENGRDLIGLHDIIYAPKFPMRQDPLVGAVAFRTKKALSGQSLMLALSYELNGKELHSMPIEVKSKAPKGHVVPIVVDLSHAGFPEAGLYTFKFKENGKTILSKKLHVMTEKQMIEHARSL